jgi:hypothetical protein
MSKANSSAAGTSDAASSSHSKDTVSRRRINMQRMQNIMLIWLNNSSDDNREDLRSTITQLQHTINTTITFTDYEECIEFLENINNNQVYMIVSGYLGQHIVPRVHDMSQVDSIFILCGNKKRHEKWAKEWAKIKGVFIEISPICEVLKEAAQQCEQNAISISFMTTSGDMKHRFGGTCMNAFYIQYSITRCN